MREGMSEGGEQEAKKQERTCLESERKEKFPAVDEALRAYEQASKDHQKFLKDLSENARDLPGMRNLASDKVKDFVTNLVPGVLPMKKLGNWIRGNLGGSLKYSSAPYQPATFAGVKDSVSIWLTLEAAAVKLGVTETFRSTEQAVVEAETNLQTELEKIKPEDMLHMIELQQKIFEQD